jgi:AraC-like DNA-binding protein
MVFVRVHGNAHAVVAGPLTTSGLVSFGEGAEILWIKFKLGAWLPHLPIREFIDVETHLPGAASHSFWLQGAAWPFPNFENTENFIARLVRRGLLACDPVVTAVLQGQVPELSPRTVRHHFLQATGITQNHIFQIERAQRAAMLLQQGVTILDTVYELGYFDQPHLTRALKQFVGYTPAQILGLTSAPIIEMSQPA